MMDLIKTFIIITITSVEKRSVSAQLSDKIMQGRTRVSLSKLLAYDQVANDAFIPIELLMELITVASDLGVGFDHVFASTEQ